MNGHVVYFVVFGTFFQFWYVVLIKIWQLCIGPWKAHQSFADVHREDDDGAQGQDEEKE
jgi:hypothetical protein